MAEPTYRPAAIGDAADIHALLLAVAGDIPLAIETLDQQEALYAAVRKILSFGESWLAEESSRIIGAVVVDNIQTGRHWGEHETLDLRYAAVDPASRDGGIIDALVGKVLERRALVTASVKDTDRTGLAARLEQLGFQPAEARLGERHFRREP